MSGTALPLTHSERFAWSMNALVTAVRGRSRGGLLAVIGVLICRRVMRVRNEFLSLLDRIAAGTLPPVRPGRTAAAPGTADAARQRMVELAKIWGKVPRRWAWLLVLVPYEAASYASQLTHLLQEEEMQRHLAAEPRLGRAFRPMCRMLGIDPAVLRLPPVERQKRPRRGGKATGSAAPVHPTDETNSDGAAWKEPSRAAIERIIATRRWPSIEMQARPERYRWIPDETARADADEKSG
jgi:hypothetical protein